MLSTIICLTAIFSLTFAMKELDGPLNIFNKVRLFLLGNKYVGVFFYHLFQCYFCLGTYSGMVIYLLHQHFQDISACDMILWGLAGSTISMVGNLLISRWSNNDQE